MIGDVVLLETGDRISADLTVLRATALAVDESMLTGESAAVHPAVGDAVRAGTFVVEGEADALVGAIGSATRLAGIAALTQRVRDGPGPLAVQLNRMVRIIAFIALGIGVVFFAVGVALGMSVSAGFLFAVGVTVALVPEGLLPTVTLSLALAAQRMARQSALVRRLDAVETLGLTTFICSDKTGTLTRNEMAAVAVWTPAGEAWLCSSGYEPEPVVVDPALVTQVRRVAGRLSVPRPAGSPRRRKAATGPWATRWRQPCMSSLCAAEWTSVRLNTAILSWHAYPLTRDAVGSPFSLGAACTSRGHQRQSFPCATPNPRRCEPLRR